MKKEVLDLVKTELKGMTNAFELDLYFDSGGILAKILKRLEKGIDPKTEKEIGIILKLFDLQIKAIGIKDIVGSLMEIHELLEKRLN